MSFMRSQKQAFPSHWQIVPFEEAFDDMTGGNAKIQTRDYLPQGALPIVDQGQAEIAGYVNDVTLACKAPLPCILFGDHTRLLKYEKRPFALGADGVKVLVPRPGLDARFALHFLQTVRLPEDLGYSRHFKYLREASVPRPPLAEQRRIAATLDTADAIRSKRKKAIALSEELLRSTFLEMFGDPLSNPNGWPVLPLSEVVSKGTIVTYGIVQAGPHVEGGIPYIRTGDIKESRILVSGLLRTSPSVAARYQRSEVRAGDLVMSIRATVGTVAVVPPELDGANLTQGTARISPGENTNREFLFEHLRVPGMQRWLQERVKGATFKEITLGALRTAPVMLAPLPLQEDFARFAAHQRSIVVKQEDALSKSMELFGGLVSRAFRGS